MNWPILFLRYEGASCVLKKSDEWSVYVVLVSNYSLNLKHWLELDWAFQYFIISPSHCYFTSRWIGPGIFGSSILREKIMLMHLIEYDTTTFILQETLLNLLLRNYLQYNLYDQAEKLRAKTQRLESHSNQQVPQILIYLGFLLQFSQVFDNTLLPHSFVATYSIWEK